MTWYLNFKHTSDVFADKLYCVMIYTLASVVMRIPLTLRRYRNPYHTIQDTAEHRITIRQFMQHSHKLQAEMLQLHCY